jgi:polar amino acid transport system substrate-binding protein
MTGSTTRQISENTQEIEGNRTRPRSRALAFVQIALLSVAMLMSAATSALAESSTPTMDRINKSGVLRVGLSGSQPPLNMKSKSGEIIGLEADLANALATSMGVKTEFIVMDFSELLDAVENDKVDIVMSSMTMTPERNRRVAFAGPYFVSGKGLLTTSAALAKTDDPSDLQGGYKLVALKGSTSFQMIEQLGSPAKALSADNYEEAVQMVIDKKADAMIADFTACLVALFQHPDAGLESAVAPFTFEPLGAALSANDPLFLNLVQNYIDMLEGIGLMQALRAKWLEDGSWLAELPTPTSAH